jgi:hypothetical protein
MSEADNTAGEIRDALNRLDQKLSALLGSRRERVATAVLAGLVSTDVLASGLMATKWRETDLTRQAVRLADILLAELDGLNPP